MEEEEGREGLGGRDGKWWEKSKEGSDLNGMVWDKKNWNGWLDGWLVIGWLVGGNWVESIVHSIEKSYGLLTGHGFRNIQNDWRFEGLLFFYGIMCYWSVSRPPYFHRCKAIMSLYGNQLAAVADCGCISSSWGSTGELN